MLVVVLGWHKMLTLCRWWLDRRIHRTCFSFHFGWRCLIIGFKIIKRPKKKRKSYGKFSPETCLKMAKYCLDTGPAKTARHFWNTLWRKVNESTVRSMKTSYLSSSLKDMFKMQKSWLPHGSPTLLSSDINFLGQQYIDSLRSAGGVVNTSIVTAGEWNIKVKNMYSVL